MFFSKLINVHARLFGTLEYIVLIEKFKAPPLDTVKIWILSRALNLERKTSDIDKKMDLNCHLNITIKTGHIFRKCSLYFKIEWGRPMIELILEIHQGEPYAKGLKWFLIGIYFEYFRFAILIWIQRTPPIAEIICVKNVAAIVVCDEINKKISWKCKKKKLWGPFGNYLLI